MSGVGDETRETEEPDKTSRHIVKVKETNPKNSQTSLSQKFKIKKRSTEIKTVGEVSSYYEVSGDKRQKISSLPSSSSSGIYTTSAASQNNLDSRQAGDLKV